MGKKKRSKKSKQDLTCFVVIGFGKKTDYATGRVLDLDATYQKLIKPSFDKVGVRCFRAIDVNVAGSIDKLMYKWLYHADFAVADLSTLNANVFYELGVRYAQRPNTTLLMAENELLKKLPFDLSHTIVYNYEHLGEEIAETEAKRFVKVFSKQLQTLLDQPGNEDSPVYTYLPGMTAPTWADPKELIAELRAKLADQEKIAAKPDADVAEIEKQSLSIIVDHAEAAKKQGDFDTAIALFKTAIRDDPFDIFLKQRLALVTYKAKEKDQDDQTAINALNEAEHILEKDCDLYMSNDPETLGLGGAVYKRLHERTGDMAYFEKSIECYERGFYVKHDYYNGINVAYMYTVKAAKLAEEGDEFSAIVNYGHANLIRNKVAKICRDLVNSDTFANRGDQEWVYMTLYEAYFGMGQQDKADKYIPKIDKVATDFGRDTFENQKKRLANEMETFHRHVRLPLRDAGAAAASNETAADRSSAVAVPDAAQPKVSRQPGGPIGIDLGSLQDKPVKSVEVTCKVEFD